MSCTLCHYITGHDPSCRYYQEEAAQDQAELRTRVEALERKVEKLDDRITDYAQLKKLYAESRDCVRTLTEERDDLVEANRRLTAQNDDFDVKIDRLRNTLISTRGFLLGVAGRNELASDVRELLGTEAADLERLLAEIPHER